MSSRIIGLMHHDTQQLLLTATYVYEAYGPNIRVGTKYAQVDGLGVLMSIEEISKTEAHVRTYKLIYKGNLADANYERFVTSDKYSPIFEVEEKN